MSEIPGKNSNKLGCMARELSRLIGPNAILPDVAIEAGELRLVDDHDSNNQDCLMHAVACAK